MNVVFKVETDSLDAIVSCLNKANVDVNSCVTTLKSVTSHNDWNCKERDQINQMLEGVKSKCTVFANEFVDYSVRVKRESDFYSELVREENKRGMEVDSDISELMALLSGTNIDSGTQTAVIANNTQSIIERIKDTHLNSWTGLPRFQRNSLYNFDKPISISNFNMIYKGLGDR